MVDLTNYILLLQRPLPPPFIVRLLHNFLTALTVYLNFPIFSFYNGSNQWLLVGFPSSLSKWYEPHFVWVGQLANRNRESLQIFKADKFNSL